MSPPTEDPDRPQQSPELWAIRLYPLKQKERTGTGCQRQKGQEFGAEFSYRLVAVAGPLVGELESPVDLRIALVVHLASFLITAEVSQLVRDLLEVAYEKILHLLV